IYAPRVTPAGIHGAIRITANYYMGKDGDAAMARMGDGEWKQMNRVDEYDPTFVAERVLWDLTVDDWEGTKPGKPGISNHLWKFNLSNNKLTKGVYPIEVRATDMFGRTFTEKSSIRVE